jgi:SAM-dependent methyltransferase
VNANLAAVWDRLSAEYAPQRTLQPPEHELLVRLRGRWHELDMLDLGVGAGRTAYTYAALTRTYVGLDVSGAMIEHARRLVDEDERTRFVVGDARDLSAFAQASFGLVLFSFNGLDAVEHHDRLRILSEVRRVVSDDGIFAFSTHSLLALPLPLGLTRPSPRDPIRSTLRSVRRALQLAATNRSLDLDAARARGYASIRDGAHDFALELYYVHPQTQLAQLADAGFAVVTVLDRCGREVDPAAPGGDAHLFYIAQPT